MDISLKIIDTHTHVFPKKFAFETVSRMAKHAGVNLYSDGTINDLLQNMKKYGVAYSATQPIATKPEQVESINSWVCSHKREEILSFGAIHPYYKDIKKELEKIKKAGLYGIKLHPDYQAFYPTDQILYPIYEICQSMGLIVTFHCGDDIGHPAPGHSLPRLIARVHQDFPRLTLIATHLGGFEMWDQAFKYLIGKQVYLETSFTFGYIEEARFYQIMNKHDKDLIMVGSDSPWGSIRENIEGIKQSSLSDPVKEKILSLNAMKLFGLGNV